jgi:hypothetical protein
MGPDGRPGASLRAWQELFPRAHVFGADIDTTVLFEEDRIRTYPCDQTDADSIERLWDQPGLGEPFDLIIDDGLHRFEANRLFLEKSVRKLRAAGIYVIEDVGSPELLEWERYFESSPAATTEVCAFLLELQGTREHPEDNNLVVLVRLS